jgi:hypothetical protein
MNISKIDSRDVKSIEMGSAALHRDQTQHRFRKKKTERAGKHLDVSASSWKIQK